MNNNQQKIRRFFNNEQSSDLNPEIEVKKCTCGKFPDAYDIYGGFNFYRYYICNSCNIFVSGMHEFPAQVLSLMPDEEPKSPKLFVIYEGENRAEKAWNNLIDKLNH